MQKITNAILLIWFIAAIALSFNNGLNFLVPRPDKEDIINECLENTEVEEEKIKCKNMYDYDQSERYELISFYTSIANVVIVGSTLFFLNRKKDVTKKK